MKQIKYIPQIDDLAEDSIKQMINLAKRRKIVVFADLSEVLIFVCPNSNSESVYAQWQEIKVKQREQFKHVLDWMNQEEKRLEDE